ncbi:transmembrane protein 205 [Palaemon carinicauda]|uniref:transmembrane protein 205 n=1 Tax=Palaemon carinicauda TaxID=392227 RepID=UPI0035B5DAA0
MCLNNMSKTMTTTLPAEESDIAANVHNVGGESKSRQDTAPAQPITRNRFHSISEFRPSEMYRSKSLGGFEMFHSDPDALTRQELEKLVDVKKKEPSKTTKVQIKEYAQKYKHFESDEKKDRLPWYREALEHTQPAHLVAILAVMYVAFRLFPDYRRNPTEASTLTRLLYVSAVSAVFGSQVWMTFVSGLALFFSVPRHVFAQVQQVLFPLYFMCNAVLMLIAVVTYTQHHPTHLWDTHQLTQGIILVTSFLVNLGIRLYLAPVLTKLITIKMAIEREAGLGQEIGTNRPGHLVHCPHYMRLYRAFRKTHMAIAAGNIVTVAATSLHLYYVATKLCSVDL